MAKKHSGGIFIHLDKWQFYLLLFCIIFIPLTLICFGIYNYYYANVYDPTLNGSEQIKEAQQHSIPPDVKKELEKKKQANVPVLGVSTVHVPILMYHYIEYVQDKNDKMRISLDITPFTLEQQVKTLKDAGYTFMSNAELADVLDGKMPLPNKPILLTFDDGYRDFYTDAYPILKKYNARATEYIITGYLDRPNHLLTTQLQELAKDGLVEIGAHTVDHAWLKGGTLANVSNEVFQSKVVLQQLINKPVVSFAYPYGAFDEQAIKVVKEAGFRTAVSTMPGIDQLQDNRYFLYRLRPGARTGEGLLTWLQQKTFSAY